jgi:hypothetical protein
MKSGTIYTLAVAMALTFSATSFAATGELSSIPVSSVQQKDTHRAAATIASAPLYALRHLDAKTLTEQAMTDQEMKAVEGTFFGLSIVVGYDYSQQVSEQITLNFTKMSFGY